MADYGIRKYRLGKAILHRSLLEGFTLEEGRLRTCADEYGVHSVFLPALDSGENGCQWGRLTLRCTLGPESMLTLRTFASDQNTVIRNREVVGVDDLLLDPAVPREEKERLFLLAGGEERSGVRDILLTEQTGRWLWLWLELSGEGDNVLEDMSVYIPGDNFLRTFPQVYRTDNDFLGRYLSIFSTMYQELQERIDTLPELLDVDTAPVELLPMFASWLGLEVDEVLFSPEEIRTLLKAAPELMAWKGTRRAVEQAVRLFVQSEVYIVERNLLASGQLHSEDMYGRTPYDFAVMVDAHMDEKLRLRLQFLIDQFKPVRSRGHIVFLKDCGGLDEFIYLDINGSVFRNSPGSLDDGKALAGMTYLD